MSQKFNICIAIPAKDELETLPQTLLSLAQSKPELLSKTLVTVNLNNTIDDPLSSEINQRTSNKILQESYPFTLKIIDRFSEELAYPQNRGVGLARKEAMDESLNLLSDDALILWLDADTLVAEDYLEKTYQYFLDHDDFQCGHVNFQHQDAESPEIQKAIDDYELYLHYYAEALAYAGSPYGFRAIGSTIAVSKKAYKKVGGITAKKQAGEDFYFLQHHAKSFGKIHFIKDAFVYPSARFSERVPFGTGQSLKQICESESSTYLTYDLQSFELIKQSLKVLRTLNFETTVEESLAKLDKVHPLISHFFTRIKFDKSLPKLQKNSKNQEKLQESIMQLFDGFQTLRLINTLTEELFPKTPIQESWQKLLSLKNKI